MARTILLIEDDDAIRKLLRRQLQQREWNILEAVDCAEANEILGSDTPIQTILSDVFLPDGLGWTLIEKARLRQDRPSFIMMTGEDPIEHAISALRRGASDFLRKPFTLEQLDDALARSCTKRPMRGSMALGVKPIDRWRCDNAPQLLGNHASVLRMLEMVRRVAQTASSVLITGESGTGKELVARAIHMASPRRLNPLVVLNCAAIPATLIESELFGHVKGAFTGATNARTGHFVAAHTGTIFLDEIGELPLNMQSKLLRVLQEREVSPLGQDVSIPIDTRIIAATNMDLERAVAEGRFREDLYYRMNVIPISIPPLRERRSDIPDLAACFINRFNKRQGSSVTLEPDLAKRLQDYDWPGNVRELENTIERMVVLKREGTLRLEDLPGPIRAEGQGAGPVAVAKLPDGGLDLRDTVDAFERDLIGQALSRARGNKARAARLVNVRRTTLIEKIKKLFPDSEGADLAGDRILTDTPGDWSSAKICG